MAKEQIAGTVKEFIYFIYLFSSNMHETDLYSLIKIFV